MEARHRVRAGWVLALSSALAIFAVPQARAQSQAPEAGACLSCHSDQDLKLALENGGSVSLHVSGDDFAHSVHGNILACTDCHVDIKGFPHPERKFKTRRELTLAYYEVCKTCHFDEYAKYLDSVHYTLLSKGTADAPVCVSCHGAHDVTDPAVPRSRISRTCAHCHQEIYEHYSQSVHGKALLETNNADVPVCTDCHQVHAIENPTTAAFRLKSPTICAGCHAQESLMKKYHLSTNVLQTYVNDFHGKTAAFQRSEHMTPAAFTAVCTDCHGVHDILPVTDPRAPVAMKSNLLTVCRRCHLDATANFPAAWLGHYEPSPNKAALVYYVKLFYQIFIPFVIVGLFLQILLHLWRAVVQR